jgi:hypothetical protein
VLVIFGEHNEPALGRPRLSPHGNARRLSLQPGNRMRIASDDHPFAGGKVVNEFREFLLGFLDRHGIHGFVPRRRAVFTLTLSITIACFLGVVKHVQGTNHPVGRDLFWHRADADPAIAVFPEPMRQLRDARSCGWTLIFLLAWSPPCAAAEVAGLGADAAEMQRRNRTW